MGFLLFCYVPPAGHRLCRSAWSLNLPKWPVGCHAVLVGGCHAVLLGGGGVCGHTVLLVGGGSCHTVLVGGCAIKIKKHGYGSCGA